MKKWTTLALAALTVLSLTGCTAPDWMTGETKPVITKDLGYLPESLFRRANSLTLSISCGNSAIGGPYQVFEIPEHMKLGTYTVLEEAELSKYDRWLTIEAGDGSTRLTVFDGYRDVLCLEKDDKISCYQDNDGTTFENLRLDFDAIEYQHKGNLSFRFDGTAPDPLREFAGTVYPGFRMNLTEGSRFRYDDYDLVYSQVQERTDITLVGEIGYYAITDDRALPEGSQPGTGIYKGWQFISETVKLELREDGAWHQVEEFGITDPTEPTNPTDPTDAPTE